VEPLEAYILLLQILIDYIEWYLMARPSLQLELWDLMQNHQINYHGSMGVYSQAQN